MWCLIIKDLKNFWFQGFSRQPATGLLDATIEAYEEESSEEGEESERSDKWLGIVGAVQHGHADLGMGAVR